MKQSTPLNVGSPRLQPPTLLESCILLIWSRQGFKVQSKNIQAMMGRLTNLMWFQNMRGLEKGSSRSIPPKGSEGYIRAFMFLWWAKPWRPAFSSYCTSYHIFRYEKRKVHYETRGNDAMSSVAMASLEASFAATMITQPVWVVKTRMLLNTSSGMG